MSINTVLKIGIAVVAMAQLQLPLTELSARLLRAPYTVCYSISLDGMPQQLKHNLPALKTRYGLLTISSDGSRMLYTCQFGTWRNVQICDFPSDTEFSYDNRYGSHSVASIVPCANTGLANMYLLPFPGVGYDHYPLFNGNVTPGYGPDVADMALPGQVDEGTNGLVASLAYAPARMRTHGSGASLLVDEADSLVYDQPKLVAESWQFFSYRSIAGIVLATRIVHRYYRSGSNFVPPKSTVSDGEVSYALLFYVPRSLPKTCFVLEHYIKSGTVIYDQRK